MSADTTTGAGPRLERYSPDGSAEELHSATPEDDARPLHPDVGVIALPVERWNAHWTSRQQVLTRLARYFHVVWMNPAPEWRDVWRRSAPARERQIPGQPSSFVVRDVAVWHSTVYHPEWLVRSVVRARLRAARESLRRRGCSRFVLYLWHKEFASVPDLVPHDASIYHIHDEFSHAEVEQPIDPAEERLIRAVDQVITLSPTMFERKGRLNQNTVRIPSGVEYEAFAQPAPEPADLAAIPHPRVGYAGFLKKQLDWELLLALATRRPDWSFVFVGARRPHPEIAPLLERLAALPNAHFLGAKPTAELARYPQHFDVCVMPYKRNDYTKYISPLKLFEYLATGRPVVSVPLPALVDAGALVTAATGVDEWETAVMHELEPDASAPAKRAARQACARENDWNEVVRRIAELIEQRLGKGVPRS